MRCPHCDHDDSKVIDSRSVELGIRRRRECIGCGARFTTYERVDNSTMSIVKKDLRRESFDREKLLIGLRRACQKRPLPTGTVEKLADEIEYELQRMGRTEVKEDKPFIELFGFKIIENECVPQNTIIMIGEIPKAKMTEFKSVADMLEYLLDKEQVFIIDAKNKIGRGFRDRTKQIDGDRGNPSGTKIPNGKSK